MSIQKVAYLNSDSIKSIIQNMTYLISHMWIAMPLDYISYDRLKRTFSIFLFYYLISTSVFRILFFFTRIIAKSY